jgi:hypothetical protein
MMAAIPLATRAGWAPLLAASLVLGGCAGAATGTDERYPEKKRPDAPRSASDDEVLGAQRQDPADTLAGSLTTGHAAPGSPHAEEPAEEAHERLEYEQCVEASKAPVTTGAAPTGENAGEPRKRPVCPPPAPSAD